MSAPSKAYFETDIKVAIATEFMSLLDVYGTCYMDIYDDSDITLARIYFTDPPGSIDANGILNLTPAGPDTSADNDGVATWMRLYNPDDRIFLTMPVIEGVTQISGYLVMTSATIVAGTPVAVTGFSIG